MEKKNNRIKLYINCEGSLCNGNTAVLNVIAAASGAQAQFLQAVWTGYFSP